MEKIRKPFDLKGRSLLKESDFTKEEFEGLIDFAMTLKTYKQQGTKHHYLEGKTSHYYSRKRQLVRVLHSQSHLSI